MGAFVKWLQEELDRRGWSQAELARQAHLSTSGVSYILTGGRDPGPVTLQAIAIALNLPEELVYERAGLMPVAVVGPPLLAEFDHLFEQLPRRDQKEIIEFIRLKLKLLGR